MDGFIENEINFEIIENNNIEEKYEKRLKVLAEIQQYSKENIVESIFNISLFINQECCLIQI